MNTRKGQPEILTIIHICEHPKIQDMIKKTSRPSLTKVDTATGPLLKIPTTI